MEERMKELYNEERNKLIPLPCIDSDFIALENAWKRYEEERIGE